MSVYRNSDGSLKSLLFSIEHDDIIIYLYVNLFYLKYHIFLFSTNLLKKYLNNQIYNFSLGLSRVLFIYYELSFPQFHSLPLQNLPDHIHYKWQKYPYHQVKRVLRSRKFQKEDMYESKDKEHIYRPMYPLPEFPTKKFERDIIRSNR